MPQPPLHQLKANDAGAPLGNGIPGPGGLQLYDGALSVDPQSVTWLPSPSLPVSGSVVVERQSLLGIGELLAAQRALQQQLELQWSTVFKRDEEVVPVQATWDQSTPYKTCIGSPTLRMGAQEDSLQAAAPSKEKIKVETESALVIAGTQECKGGLTDNSQVFSPSSENKEGFASEQDTQDDSKLRQKNSAVTLLAEGLEQERQLQEELKLKLQRGPWVEFVKSDRFDLLIGVIILVNTLVMLVNVELTGIGVRDELFGQCPGGICIVREYEHKEVFQAMEHAFTTLYLMEILIRLAAMGPHYFCSLLHFGDLVIVVISIIDVWILQVLLSSNSAGMAVLRVARLAKLAKVFRVMRVLRAFKQLRILVNTIAHSVSALLWSMTLLFVFELIGSIFIAQLFQSFINDSNNDLELRRRVWQRFGTWSRAMLSIYEITMSPGGFLQYRDIIDSASPLVLLFFVLYVCTVTFAVIRVITALFLRATLSACDQDDNQEALATLKMRNEFAERLKVGIDVDGSGGIDMEEFEILIAIPEMKDWLSDVGLSHDGAARIFAALQQEAEDDSTGEMNFHAFLVVLTQMSGQARSCDLLIVSHESQKALNQTAKLLQSLTKHIAVIEQHVGVTRSEVEFD